MNASAGGVRASGAEEVGHTVPQTPEEPTKGIVCVIDLGEQTRRRVRRLRRGEGRLMERVEDAVTALQDNGVLAREVQTVVVVVKQEPSFAGLFGDDDDEDDDDEDDDA